jgi:hypothetical protein
MSKTIFQRVQEFFVKLIAKIRWKNRYQITIESKADIRQLLTDNYYIIATRRHNFLSTFFINLGHFFLTGRWGYYTHTLMNLENEVNSDDDFRLVEATTRGTTYSSFDRVFAGVDAAILLQPMRVSVEDWTTALENTEQYIGHPYDNLFDMKNDQEINCVELVILVAKSTPGFESKFPNLQSLLETKRTITPQMLVDCPDFRVAYEARATRC